jgi:DNA-binding transcriptional ArsR family regulator
VCGELLIFDTNQQFATHNLKSLKDAGLVKRRQQGTTVFCSIADAMVFELCEMICSRLHDRLEAQVGALKARMRG